MKEPTVEDLAPYLSLIHKNPALIGMILGVVDNLMPLTQDRLSKLYDAFESLRPVLAKHPNLPPDKLLQAYIYYPDEVKQNPAWSLLLLEDGIANKIQFIDGIQRLYKNLGLELPVGASADSLDSILAISAYRLGTSLMSTKEVGGGLIALGKSQRKQTRRKKASP